MPPVSGIIAPSSANISAPNKENNPAMIQTAVNHIGEPNWAAIEDGFMNTPEPMMLPIIIEVADQYPIFLASVVDMKGR
jgi:hypothetical protein